MNFFSLKSKADSQEEPLTVVVEGCSPEKGGVGIELNVHNVILELRAGSAAEKGGGLRSGDRVVAIDGEQLNYRQLAEVIKPSDNHTFEIMRTVGWMGFNMEETQLEEDEEGFVQLDRIREVTLQKSDGQIGINPEVYFPEGSQGVIKIAKVYPGSHASATGVVSQGDIIRAINGKLLTGSEETNPLDEAVRELSQVADGVDITLQLESDTLYAGFMQKRGEKGMKTWQKRFFTLVWSEINILEREMRYYEGQDYCTRKQKGSIDLTRAEEVQQVLIEGGAGITIKTPGRLWELLPSSAAEAHQWFALLTNVTKRNRGLAVVASVSNLSFNPDQVVEGEEPGARQGELTVVLQRKLGMSINKLNGEVVIAQLDQDGAAAACGLLSVGDALVAINGSEVSGCKQAIKMLTSNPAACQLQLCSKVVHAGWMHKLGEGFGGWTTRYFTLTYELDSIQALQAANQRVSQKMDAGKVRQRASSMVDEGPGSVLVRLHKPTAADKLGIGLIEDEESRVIISRLYAGYIASNSATLFVGDVLLAVNGQPIPNQETALKLLIEAVGTIEVRLQRTQDPGCWVLRYYDAKNSVARVEKGTIRLNRESIREINKYTLQDDDGQDGVPRVGLYILQEERCWELLPPEEELEAWIAKLQLVIWGQEVISADYVRQLDPAEAESNAAKLREMKGSRVLNLQQQYGLVLATYDKPPPGALPPPADVQGVYIMSFEMDGAGACTGMLTPNDRIIEVDGEPADTLQQVTSRFKGSAHEVKVKVASRVVFGGFMLKKGELNTEFQIRWFLLVDEDECAVLRYYDGRNAVTRKLKGEIKISPQEVRSVRSYLHEDVVTGAKTPGVVINQAGRTWELLTKTAAESRMWVSLLHSRVRPTGRRSVAEMQGDDDMQRAVTTHLHRTSIVSTRL